MKVLMLVPLLAACAGSWPTGSYVDTGSDTDAGVLAPAVSDCVSTIVKPPTAITLASASTNAAVSSVIADVLKRDGVALQGGGDAVSYVIAPLGAGEFIRVSTSRAACSQYFRRESGSLKPDGPLMVITR